ncbi:MAG: hypothetical protein HQK51_04000 [Oligoflexia bacterium]|nr:hypothetical protein [Oligoflexia bacterium]
MKNINKYLFLLFLLFVLLITSLTQAYAFNLATVECMTAWDKCMDTIGDNLDVNPCYNDSMKVGRLQCHYSKCICVCSAHEAPGDPSAGQICSNTTCLPHRENLRNFKYSKACQDWLRTHH